MLSHGVIFYIAFMITIRSYISLNHPPPVLATRLSLPNNMSRTLSMAFIGLFWLVVAWKLFWDTCTRSLQDLPVKDGGAYPNLLPL